MIIEIGARRRTAADKRCTTCRHWQPGNDFPENKGACGSINDERAMWLAQKDGRGRFEIITSSDTCCSKWEAK